MPSSLLCTQLQTERGGDRQTDDEEEEGERERSHCFVLLKTVTKHHGASEWHVAPLCGFQRGGDDYKILVSLIHMEDGTKTNQQTKKAN